AFDAAIAIAEAPQRIERAGLQAGCALGCRGVGKPLLPASTFETVADDRQRRTSSDERPRCGLVDEKQRRLSVQLPVGRPRLHWKQAAMPHRPDRRWTDMD